VPETELIEVITHLAFYICWPKAMTAMTVAKQAFANWNRCTAQSTPRQPESQGAPPCEE
jgi:hypothetical protein